MRSPIRPKRAWDDLDVDGIGIGGLRVPKFLRRGLGARNRFVCMVHNRHARESAPRRAETPIKGNGREKSRRFRASNCRPLPIMSSTGAPDSGPLTLRSEISQGIARRHVGNLCVDQKENLRSGRASTGRAHQWEISSAWGVGPVYTWKQYEEHVDGT